MGDMSFRRPATPLHLLTGRHGHPVASLTAGTAGDGRRGALGHPVAFWVGLVAAIFLIDFLVAHLHGYPYGLYLDLPFGHWFGVELAPSPGCFFDVD
jgi:hypothetical protein